MTSAFLSVQDLLENYRSAVYEKDVERFLAMYSSEVQIYDCWGTWATKGISSWRENVEEWFNSLTQERVLLKVNFSEIAVEENLDIAYIHCAVTFAAHQEDSGDKLRQMTNRFTFGLRKVTDSWQVTHEHSSLPINIETGKGIFKYE